MNPRTYRHTSSAQQLPEAKQGRVPLSGYPEKNIQNPYGLGMPQAVEFAKSACSTAVCLNSCLMDFYRHFFWYPLGLEYWFEGQSRAFATMMDLGTQCLCMQAPHASSTPAPCAYCHPGMTDKEFAKEMGMTDKEFAKEQAEETEEMEHGMDVAVEAFEEEILA
jgi:hypothetical protein